MRAAYLRVSLDKQDHKSQKHAIVTYLKNHNVDMSTVRWYTDTITGSVMTRDGMDALNKDIFMGEITEVIVFKLDRLARDMRGGVNLLADWMDKGCRVISLMEQIDLSGPVGRMLAAVFFALAEIERNNIRERILAGTAVAKAAGKYKGRKPGTYKANPMRVAELRARGLTYEEIATSLGVAISTVFRYARVKA